MDFPAYIPDSYITTPSDDDFEPKLVRPSGKGWSVNVPPSGEDEPELTVTLEQPGKIYNG